MQGGISQINTSSAKWFKSHLALKNNSHHQKEQRSTMSIVSIDAPILYKIIDNKIKNNYLKGNTSSIDCFFQEQKFLYLKLVHATEHMSRAMGKAHSYTCRFQNIHLNFKPTCFLSQALYKAANCGIRWHFSCIKNVSANILHLASELFL